MPDSDQPIETGDMPDSAAASSVADVPIDDAALAEVVPGSTQLWRHAMVVEIVSLLAIVLMALWLRFRGIDWALGYYLHPDELHISDVLFKIKAPVSFREYLNSATSPLNPFNQGTDYTYGTFPLFLTKFVGSFTEYTQYHNNQLPGRWLSALADTGSVVFVWWIGRMIWNRWVGLMAALLLALTVLNIQTAHYATADSWATFFATGTLALVLAAWYRQKWALYALAGLFTGLGAASKPTMLATVGFLALPALETVRVYGWGALHPGRGLLNHREDDSDAGPLPIPVLLASGLAVLVAVWTFRIAQPYDFLGQSIFSFKLDPRWSADLEFWRGVQSGAIDYYPSLQWTERAPILFQLENLFWWGMGPGLGLASLCGFGWVLWRIVVSRAWPSWITLIPAGWVLFHLVYFGIAMTKVQRYLLPAYPVMVLFGAALLVAALRWGWQRGRIQIGRFQWNGHLPRWCHPGVILPALVVLSTAFYAFAFVSIYTEPNSRAAASTWMAENIPSGSVIANEYWDLGLPVGVPEMADVSFEGINIEPYADENPEKVSAMVGALQRADYVVLSSNRLIDSVSRLPWRYPVANAYYDALFSGELGFQMVGHFTSYPTLFGISLDDRNAEESFTVYDHPEVYIFQKTETWNAHTAWYLLDDALGHGGLSIRPVQTQPDHMMLDVSEQEAVRTGASWSSVFDVDSLANRVPVVVWYVAFQIVTLASVPLLWRLFPWLPDRGYALSKTLGLFLVAWVGWWLSSLGAMGNGLPLIAVAWCAVLAASVLAAWRKAAPLVDDLRQRRWWIVATEGIVAGGFALAAWVRSGNPDLILPGFPGNGLRHLATFTANVMTPSFPAYDPWLVDGAIHDFSFGYVPWAMLTRLTGIVPETAYSLSLAMLATLLMLNAWLLASVLVGRLRPAMRSVSVIWCGLAGLVMVIGVGSWGMAQRIGTGDWGPNFEGTPLDALRGLLKVVSGNGTVPDGAWRATSTWAETGTLQFPLLSYLSNEMAISQLGLPLLLAALVVVLGFLNRPFEAITTSRQPMASFGTWPEVVPWLAVAGGVTGWLVATNPLFGGAVAMVTGAMVLLTSGTRAGWHSSWATLRDMGLMMLAYLAVVAISIWPFLQVYGTFATQRENLAEALSTADMVSYLGAGLIVVLVAVAVQCARAMTIEFGLPKVPWAGSIPVVLMVLAIALAWITGFSVLLLAVAGLLVGFLLWYHHDALAAQSLLALVLIALLTGMASTRLAFISWSDEQNISQQWSLVCWTLLAVAAAVIVPVGCLELRDRIGAAPGKGKQGWQAIGPVVLGSAACVLVLASAVYPAVGIPNQQDDRLGSTSRTLDSVAFMNTAENATGVSGWEIAPYSLSGDLVATRWLREHFDGMPTVLEVPSSVAGGWGGRVSALTGFPTVLGSVPVQMQQRPGMDRLVNWRQADINAIYGDAVPFETIAPMLQDYGVQIIYIGPLERAAYNEAGLAKFPQAVADGVLQELYNENGVVMYYFPEPRVSLEFGS